MRVLGPQPAPPGGGPIPAAIESEEDMLDLMRGHEELAQLLLEDPEDDRSEMSERMFGELARLRELNERKELQKAKQALEEKDRQKDQFIAVLAHELRNPLGAIRTAAYALHRLNLQDTRAGPLVERVDRQTTAIARMLEDLLDASRIAFGKVSVQLEPFDLRGLLTDAFDEQQSHARQAGLCAWWPPPAIAPRRITQTPRPPALSPW
jgi:signal transduction histidine kinase